MKNTIELTSNDTSNDISNLKLVTIYLGNTCNFDCNYCDRGYIEKIGGQNLSNKSSEELKEFFAWITKFPNKIESVAFHGGEPLLFEKRIKQIMEWLYPIALKNKWRIGITTNGSLVKKCEDLFKKYSKVFHITVSYDFYFQEQNRDKLDVYEMAEVLNTYARTWQWQYVLPIDHPKSFSFDNLKNIISTCNKTKCNILNIIPLRHKRGKDKFEVIIDNIPLASAISAFIDFVQILYIKRIRVFIDGAYDGVDKAYFSDHQKIVLSPDGYMYPEFDFLEYKSETHRIGNWKQKQFWKKMGDNKHILPECQTCSSKSMCGLKYLYKMFDETPKGSCKEFYVYINLIMAHLSKLREKDDIFSWVGYDENFLVNE